MLILKKFLHKENRFGKNRLTDCGGIWATYEITLTSKQWKGIRKLLKIFPLSQMSFNNMDQRGVYKSKFQRGYKTSPSNF